MESEEGEWKWYYTEKGNLEEIANFKDGNSEGEYKWYYKNGKLHVIGNYFPKMD